jgi:hypothetical protein
MFDKQYRFIERVTGLFITAIHDEANNYAFKTVQGEWKTINKQYVDDNC